MEIKIYTQEDFNKLEKDEFGYTICPTGVYTDIKEFPNKCIFGERCSFGKCCSFGESCSFGRYCNYCLFEFNKLVNINGLYTYPIRIYFNTVRKEYFLSIGCENFATLDDCKARSKERNGDNDNIHSIVENIINEVLK